MRIHDRHPSVVLFNKIQKGHSYSKTAIIFPPFWMLVQEPLDRLHDSIGIVQMDVVAALDLLQGEVVAVRGSVIE